MDRGEEAYRRFLGGEEEAFDQIMEAYRFRLIFFIQRFVSDPDTAEDIAMDVFVHLLMHPKKYRFGTRFDTYLFLLAKSRALDYLRRKNKFQWVHDEGTLDQMPSSELPEEMVLQSEVSHTVNEAIKKLPEEMQRAVHLVYFESFTYKETAEILKKSPKQVDNLLTRAKEKLKNILGKEGESLL